MFPGIAVWAVTTDLLEHFLLADTFFWCTDLGRGYCDSRRLRAVVHTRHTRVINVVDCTEEW